MIRKLLLFVLLFSTATIALAQTEKIWTKIEKLKPFEAKFMDEAGLVKPHSIKRYFRLKDGVTENFKNEAIYVKDNNLIDEQYIYYNVSFIGEEYSFTINFDYSAGRAMTWHGTYFVEGNEKLLTEYYYGTSAGTVQLTRNGKKVYKKEIEFDN